MSDQTVTLERYQQASEALVTQPGYPRIADYVTGYGSAPDEHKALNELVKWWRAIFKRKWLIAAIAFVVTSVVTIEVFRILPRYRATTVIEIGRDNSTFLKSGDLIIQNDDTLKTKMFILASNSLLEDLAETLKLDQNPRFSRDLVFDEYDTEYRKRTHREAVKAIFGKIAPEEVGDRSPQSTVDSVVLPVVLPANNATRSQADHQRIAPFVRIIQRGLDVDALPETRLLTVSYEHSDPAIAATVSNAIARVFIQRSYEGRTDRFTKASEWVERTTRELKQRAEEAEQALAAYIRDHKIASPSGNSTLTAEKLRRLHDEAMRAETDRLVKESLFDEVKQGRIAQVPETFTDPRTSELQKKLGELATNAAQLEVNYGPENPQVSEVQQQIAAVQKQIESSRKTLAEKFKADYERAVRDEQSFKAALERARAEAVQENLEGLQYDVLQQSVETSKALYKGFQEKTNPATFDLAQQQNNIRIVEPARVPKMTSSPKRRQWILLGFALSLAGGVGLALLLEYVNNTIRSVDDVTRYVQLPALGVIPSVNSKTRRLLLKRWKSNPQPNGGIKSLPESTNGSRNGNRFQLIALDARSPGAEAYRLLRTSVMLFATGGPAKTLLVTSSQPGEGKTTTCINTAISLAQLGESVLIIDCDLRTPTVHKAFDLGEVPGLSTYLTTDANIDELIRKLDLPGLSLLPCGPIPPNPADLISSAKMKEMLDMLSARYDHILIDSPPLINLADPIILSLLVDGVMLVVRGGKSNREAVRHARQELMNVGASVLGVVLNNVDFNTNSYKYYHS